MSDTATGEFDQIDNDTQPGKLRQLLEQALAANRQLTEKVSQLETAEAQRAVTSTWDELKVPDAIRKLYSGDTSPDAIKSWWEDSKGLFNIQAADEQPATPQLTPEQEAQQANAKAFQEAAALGSNAYLAGFDTVQQNAKQAIEAYKAGQMSRADYDAAVAKAYEGLGTRPD